MDDIGIILVEEESKYNEMFDFMFKDLYKYDSFTTIIEKDFKNHWAIQQCNRRKLNKLLFNLPRRLSYYFLNLPKAIRKYSKRFKKTIAIIPNSSIHDSCITLELLQILKRKYKNIVWVMFYFDSVSFETSARANKICESGFFDIVYTMDDADAKRYSLIKYNIVYSKDETYNSIAPQTDIFYCGAAGKNREKLVEEISDSANENGAVFSANISWYTSNTRENIKTAFLPYDETLKKSLKANCILEVVADYQNGLTLRPYEAICYDRKLLTNNKAIFNFEYYNPQYMHYFEKSEDIDWNWVRNKEFVDYEYKGNFSPVYLIEDILTRINNTL